MALLAKGALHFVVRALPSPSKELDGVFRVHLTPDCLEQVSLKVGDICEIVGGNGDVVGHGIAWRATDRMGSSPRVRPAKMTESLRLAFGISEGSHVNIAASKTELVWAEKVVLNDVTPADYGRVEDMEDDRWILRAAYAMGANCEAFASGTTFDVKSKKGSRRRFFIEHIASSAPQGGPPSLYFCTDETNVIISSGSLPVTPSIQSLGRDFNKLTADHIGGLVEQLEALNRRMKRVLKQVNTSKYYAGRFPINEGILVHGYEGTGKSLLLDRMEHVGFRSVFRLQKSTLNRGTIAKNQEAITDIFNDALVKQPSLILMDDIDKLAPSTDDSYTDAIVKGLAKISGLCVLVVGACRSPSDVNSAIMGHERLSTLIELPIPNLWAREEILKLLLHHSPGIDGPHFKNVSMRTHGFTGKDLGWLVQVANGHAIDRYDQQAEFFERLVVQTVNDNGSSEKTSDGTSIYSEALTHVEYAQEREKSEIIDLANEPELKLEDFEFALTKVRPTALREIFFETPKIQWSDIGGSKAMKERFDKIIGWPLRHEDLMEQYRKRPKKGVLLYGPPGCSKTLTAQAVATTYELNFIAIKGAELISMYVGESERAVREVFRKARAASPCVIFFDEIDSIASERESGGTKGLNVLTTLLNEMDGFQSLKGVLVLAATNKPEVLDPAIMRPGRFDSHLYLGPPNAEARKEIFHISTKGLPIEDGLKFDKLVDKTNGHTGAEIVQICDLATDEAMERKIAGGNGAVSIVDFETALEHCQKAVSADMIAAYEAFAQKGSTP